MRKERHIYFEEEVYKTINEYSINKNKSINETINILVKLGMEADSNIKLVTELKNSINRIDKNSYLTFLLVKQLYSDFDFDLSNITNPRKSEPLNMFFSKIKKDKYID